MKKQWIAVGVIVAVLTAGAVLGVKLAPDIFPVEVGSLAPDFRAVNLATGDTVGLERYRGQVVLINIWATWCEPCRVEMPSIQRLYDEFSAQGFRVAAISIDEADPEVVRNFQRSYNLTFEILHDRRRTIERIYQTTGVPETFILNREGRIVKKMIGAHEWDSPANRDLIRRLLARRS
ncbi:MAG TPA: TlpA disulfide reductase family protein [Gemmatimonadales bacterium]|nr:TlpA disulfide reductase family protein [Gemmatimonadales bacterium]